MHKCRKCLCVCVYWGRGRGWGDALYLDWELRRSEARRPIVSLEEHWSFGRKATFECSMNKSESHDVSILWVFQKNPVGRLCMDTRLWAHCVYLNATNTIGINWKPAHSLFVYDVNQTVGLIFTISGQFYNQLNGGLVRVPYKTTEL